MVRGISNGQLNMFIVSGNWSEVHKKAKKKEFGKDIKVTNYFTVNI